MKRNPKRQINLLLDGEPWLPWTSFHETAGRLGFDADKLAAEYLYASPPAEVIDELLRQRIDGMGLELRSNPKSRKWAERETRKLLDKAGIDWRRWIAENPPRRPGE